MKLWQVIALATMLPACATWIHETELPETLKQNQFALGGTLGVAPSPTNFTSNYPATAAGSYAPTGFLGVRYGLVDRLELSSDLTASPGAFIQSPGYAGGLRVRYQWLDAAALNLASAVSVGGFLGHGRTIEGGDAGSNPAIPGGQAGDTLLEEGFDLRGFSLSDSVGYRVLPELMLYAGPKLYWVSFDGDYSHSIVANSESLHYSGFAYGGFLGGAWTFALSGERTVVVDLMATLVRVPANLRTPVRQTWMPGVSLGAYWLLW